MSTTISPHSGIVYLMVTVSASDSEMTDQELMRIGNIVQNLSVFKGYDVENLLGDAETCAEILGADGGFEAVIGLAREAIPDTHVDTAYALACEVAAVDGHLSQEEIRVLELIRHGLDIDRLTAAALERCVAARNRPL